MKIVSEELVFPYPQNWQFLALRTEKAVNAKKTQTIFSGKHATTAPQCSAEQLRYALVREHV